MPAPEEDKPVMTTQSTVATVDVRIILAGLWTALMLIYLLGDVLRIFAGDFEPGRMQGQAAGQWMWLVAAAVMLVALLFRLGIERRASELGVLLAVGFVAACSSAPPPRRPDGGHTVTELRAPPLF